MNAFLKKLSRTRYLLIVMLFILVQATPSNAQVQDTGKRWGGLVPDSPLQPEENMQVNFRSQLGGASYAVAVSGIYAYVGIGPRLVVLDISDPTKPLEIVRTDILPGIVQDIALLGNYAFVAASDAGLRVIDISTPSAPKEAGFYNTPGYAYGVALSAGYAYVADSSSGLQIINISVPADPVAVGFYDTPGLARDVAISGKFALVADDSSGLRVIDISTPSAPNEVGFYLTPGYAQGVAISGDYAYVADGTSGLRIINIYNPEFPVEVGSYDTVGNASAVFVSGSYAFVADGNAGLLILHIPLPPAPPTPEMVGFWNTPGSTYQLVISGSYAYVADTFTGMRVINIFKFSEPYEVGFYDPPGYAIDVAVSGSYAYIVDGGAGLRIVNVSNPDSPFMVGYYDTPGYAYGVAVSGSYAYIADYHYGLRIINISNPASPWEVGYYDVDGFSQDVAVLGSYVYLADFGVGLRILNVSNPAAPVFVGSCPTPGYLNGVAVSGNYAYIADGFTGLRIINISNPASPVEVGFYDTPGYSQSVVVSGSYAYVADETALRIVDVSTPSVPVEVGSYDTPGYAYGVVVSGSYAFVADYHYGLQILNISNPASITLVGSYFTSGYTFNVAVSSSYAYLADLDGGFFIVQACLIPETPLMVAPANGLITNNNKPNFDWDAASYASHYLFEMDDNPAFTSPAIATTVTTTYLNITSPLADSLYYWRVRGRNLVSGCNVSGAPAGAWTVTIDATPPGVPALSAPVNNATTGDSTPTFAWNSSSGAALYQIQVDNDSGFNSPEIDLRVETTSYTPDTGLPVGSHYWRVGAQDEAGNWSGFSAAWSLTIIPCNTPGAAQLVAPANGSITYNSLLAFDWNAASNATDYLWQVSEDNTFQSPTISMTTTLTSSPGYVDLPDGLYYWRVLSHNSASGCDVYGAYSALWTVTVDTLPPPVPALSAPSNASSTVDTTPSFSWNASSGAVNYRFQVDNNSDFSSPEIDQTTTGLSYTPATALPLGDYFWHVRAQDAAGNWSSYSGAWSLSIVSCSTPGTPVLVAPANGSTINDSTPLLDWDAVSGANEYEIQVDDNNDFNSTAVDILSALTYFTPGTLADATYYWRVRGYNSVPGCDVFGPYSEPWTVTIDTTVSHSVYLPFVAREYMSYFEGPNEVEPNDLKNTANGPIRSVRAYTGTFGDENDYFFFVIGTPGAISITLTHTGSGVQLLLYDASTQLGSDSGEKPTLQIDYSSALVGWYYVRIYTAYPGPSGGSYTLTVSYP